MPRKLCANAAKSLIPEHLTRKSLFLKDLEEIPPKSLIPQDQRRGVCELCNSLPGLEIARRQECAIGLVGSACSRHRLVRLREIRAGFACRRNIVRSRRFENLLRSFRPLRVVGMH